MHGWAAAAAVTALAAALRLPALGRPRELVFDETYYVKDAWTLLNLGYEGQWPAEPDPDFVAGEVDGYTTTASYVVHPPVGKWLIALGLRLLGAQDPVGWRLAAALAGIVSVLLLTRIAGRLLRSTALGVVAGTLLALDGLAIVHSRTALLDGFLMMFVLAAFGALLLDRDAARTRLAALTGPPRAAMRWGPSLGPRPWRLAAGVLLGLAVGTKWSGLWFVAAFGLLSVAWDASARERAGVRRWWLGTLVRDAGPAFASIVGVGALTYLASWFSWFRSPAAYGRTWATDNPGQGVGWLPETMRSLWKFHQDMWSFHTTLDAEHPYAAHPAGWLLQIRPTAFFYTSPAPAEQYCGADACSQAVTSLGNPILWWLAAAALVACLWWALWRLDGVAAVVVTAVAAGWLPWFAYAERTIFTFYAIVFLPWLIIGLTHAGGRLWRWGDADRARRRFVRTGLVALGLLVVAATWFFYPVWTAEVVTFRYWQLHQWVQSWL